MCVYILDKSRPPVLRSACIVVFLIMVYGQTSHADMQPASRTSQVVYEFTVRRIPADAADVQAWIPVPLSNHNQTLLQAQVGADLPYSKIEGSEHGNEFLRFDLSDAVEKGRQTVTVRTTFVVQRKAVNQAYPATDEYTHENGVEEYLGSDSLVPTGGIIAQEAERIAGSVKDPLSRAKRLFEHIVRSMEYDKSTQGWGRGDALRACNIRSGNCTDFHSLYIGEARSLGMPARFVMGLPVSLNRTQGDIDGYHCWVEFYAEGKGWLPLDASETSKHPAKKEKLFGSLPADRIAFSIGRDIVIPGSFAGPRNYVIYPYVEVDGEKFPHVKTNFSFQEAENGTIPQTTLQ